MANIYVSSAEWTAVTAWAALTAYVSTSNGGRGDYRRQLAGVAVGSERVFRCTTSGTSLAAEPAWTLTKNATTTEVAGPVWTECTGQEADQVSGTWKAPHARLANAFTATWGAAADVFYVADTHAETQAAALTLTSPGTEASPCAVRCVTKSTVPPASANLTTGATITTTGANALTVTGGDTVWEGVDLKCGTGATSVVLTITTTIGGVQNFKRSKLRKLGTTATGAAITGSTVCKVILDNTQIFLGVSGDRIRPYHFHWKNTPSAAITQVGAPTNGVLQIQAGGGVPVFDGIDLTGNPTLVQSGASQVSTVVFKNCKTDAGVTLGGAGTRYCDVLSIISDSAATNYLSTKSSYDGLQTTETTVVRTGGASDGATPVAWKIVTTANSKLDFPFESLPLGPWNDTIAANRTITLYGIWGGGAVPTNADIWFEVSYLGSGSTPLASFATCGVADVLAAGTNHASDSSTWGGSTTKFAMSITLSAPQPAMKGPISITIKAAKASSTFYIDPKPVLS